MRAVWVATVTAADCLESTTILDLVTLPAGTYLHDIVVHTRVSFDGDGIASFGFNLNRVSLYDHPEEGRLYIGGGTFGYANVNLRLIHGDDNAEVSGNPDLVYSSLWQKGGSGGGVPYSPTLIGELPSPLQIEINAYNGPGFDEPPTVGEVDVWLIIEDPDVPPPPLLHFSIDAVVLARPSRLFEMNAIIERGFRIDAWIRAMRSFPMDAVIRAPTSGSFGVDAEIVLTRPRVFQMDARIKVPHTGSFGIKAWIDPQLLTRTGAFAVDAWIIPTRGGFAMDAQIAVLSTPVGSFGMDAEVSQIYRQASFGMAAQIRTTQLALFELNALITRDPRSTTSGSFAMDAQLASSFALDAYIAQRFAVDAWIRRDDRQFSMDAEIAWSPVARFGVFTLDALVARGVFAIDAVVQATRLGEIVPFIAWIINRPSGSFAMDAQIAVAGGFTIDAYVAHAFRIEAFIQKSEGGQYWPPEGGPPIDPGTGQPWEPPTRWAKVRVTIDGADVTEHVLLERAEFTQAAGTSAGSFALPLRGTFPQYDGGEEVLVFVDEFRQFGGLVEIALSDYRFPDVPDEGDDEHRQLITMLTGVDLNGILDRVMIYNVPNVGGRTSGAYKPIPPLPKALWDKEYIQTVLSKYIDPPWRRVFDFATFVEEVSKPSTVPFTVETGQSLRTFIAGITKMTNAVASFDAFYNLHYHRRSNANAPYAITDNSGSQGGVSCRNLQIVRSVAGMINDNIVYGTLATTIEGEIIYSRHKDDGNIAQYGLWQYVEARSDLHIPAHVSQRGAAIELRRDLVVQQASFRVFQRGFQAGQVATLFSDEYGVAVNLPIRRLTLTFPLLQGSDGAGGYYAVPAYDLLLALDPEDPWNLYDALPFEPFDTQLPTFGIQPISIPHLQLDSSGGQSKGTAEICVDAPMTHIIFRDDFERGGLPTGDGGCQQWLFRNMVSNWTYNIPGQSVRLDVPPPWCITVASAGTGSVSLWNANFFVVLHSQISSMDVRSQQSDPTLGSTYFFNINTGWPEAIPFYARIRRVTGGLTVAIWAQDGSQPTVEHSFDLPYERTLWPDSTLWASGQFAGIAVAAGGGGTGMIWNAGSLFHAAEGPPNSIEVDLGQVAARSWLVQHLPPNGVAFRAHGDDQLVVTPGNSGASPTVNWGYVDDFHGEVYEVDYVFKGFMTPPGVRRLRMQGQLQNVELTGRQRAGVVPWVIGLTDYVGGGNYDAVDPLASGAGGGFGHGPDFGQDELVGSFDAHRPVSHAGEDLQFTFRWTNFDVFPSQFLPSAGQAFWDLILGFRVVTFTVEWDGPDIECGDASPLNVIGACADTSTAYYRTGWVTESRRVSKTGAFSSSLPVVAPSVQVYLDGLLLDTPTDWVFPDWVGDEGVHQSFQLVKAGPRCVTLVYLAATAEIGTQSSAKRLSSGNVLADQKALPDIRPV